MLYEIPNDPTYAKCKIEDLCTYLGYPPNNKAAFEKKKITSGLAKLMCVQELCWRRNENSKAARETTVDPYKDDDRADSGVSIKKSYGHHDSDGAHYESENDDEARRAISRNIQVHLDYAYPLSIPPQASIPDSLFSNELDLENIDPFPMRYIHEHCLYHCRPANEPEFTKFAKYLHRHYHIECDENDIEQMSRMLKRFVRRIVKIWGDFKDGGYGFLVELGNNVIRKTADFEAVWKAHRERWIQLVHRGSTDSLLEIQHAAKCMAFRTPNAKGSRGQKRALESPATGSLPRSETSTSKRQRTEDSQSDHLEGSTICVESAAFEETGSNYSAEPKDPEETASTVLSILGNLRQVPEGSATPNPTPNRSAAKATSKGAPPKPKNTSNNVAQPDKSAKKNPVHAPTPTPTTVQVSIPEKGKYSQVNRDVERPTKAPSSNPSPSDVIETPKAPAGQPGLPGARVNTPKATNDPTTPTTTTPRASNKTSSLSRVSNHLPVLDGLVKPPASNPRAIPGKPGSALGSSSGEAQTTQLSTKSQTSTSQPDIAKSTTPILHSHANHRDAAPENAKAAPTVELPSKLRASLNQLKSAANFTPDCSSAHWEEIKSKFASPSKLSVTKVQDQSPFTGPDSSANTPQNAPLGAPEAEVTASTSEKEMSGPPVSRSIAIGSEDDAKTSVDDHKRASLPSPISRSGSIDISMKQTNEKIMSTDFISQMDAVLATSGEPKLTQPENATNEDLDPMKSPQTKFIKHSSSVLCDSPRKPTLQFAIQDTDGFHDDSPSRLVSLKKLANLSLAEFFQLVEIRSGQSEGDFDCVTVRYQWGDGVAHMVNRKARDEHWKATTNKMDKFFFNAKNEFRKRKEFLVWVSCGDRTNLMEDSEEEVDEMEE